MLLCAYLTVAGTGVSACIGGAATSAQFKLPNVVAMNGTSLYVVRLVFGDWLLCARADAPPSLYAERLQLRHDPLITNFMTPSSAIVSTVAGTCTPGTTGDGGPVRSLGTQRNPPSSCHWLRRRHRQRRQSSRV